MDETVPRASARIADRRKSHALQETGRPTPTGGKFSTARGTIVRFVPGLDPVSMWVLVAPRLLGNARRVCLMKAIPRLVGLLVAANLIGSRAPPARAGEPQRFDRTGIPRRDSIDESSLGRMRSLRAWRVITELKLDEAAAARVLPIFARYDERDLALLAERLDITCELRALLAAPRPDDSHISRALDRLAASHSHRRALHDERLDELRRVLPPAQQARLLLLLPGLERDFGDWGRQAIGGGPQSCDHASRDEAVGRSTAARAARRGQP